MIFGYKLHYGIIIGVFKAKIENQGQRHGTDSAYYETPLSWSSSSRLKSYDRSTYTASNCKRCSYPVCV